MIELLQNYYVQIIAGPILVVLVTFLLVLFFNSYFKKKIKKLSKIKSLEVRKVKQTRLRFLNVFLITLIYIFAIIRLLFFIPGFEAFSISLLAGAGIAAIVIGFAAQKTLANIVSGISIAIYSPFRIGDRLKILEEVGDVEDLTLRHTVIKTWDNRRIIIPNALIAEKEIVNYSIHDEKLLWSVNIGVSYDTDTDEAKKIIIAEAKKHPDVIVPEIKKEDGSLDDTEPIVRITEFGDFAVNLRLYFWVSKPGKAWVTGFDILENVKKEFDKRGIEIPFPYRTIVYKKDIDEMKKKLNKNRR